MTRIASFILVAIAVISLNGCAEPGPGPAPVAVNLAAWQRGVERYIDEEGNGDPNILRDTTLPSSAPGYALMGEASIDRSTDANGLLLGHKRIDGVPWFVFIVGLVKAGTLNDIRLVALCCEGGSFRWTVSGPDADVMESYAAATNGRGGDFPTFPAEGDRFDLTVEGRTLCVTHEASGARWQLPLAAENAAEALQAPSSPPVQPPPDQSPPGQPPPDQSLPALARPRLSS